jgi:hypothetical protein
VTKCDTNTSPRRLATHLLQQVDQSFTLRRHRGHESANATRNNTNANDHTTIAKASKASSEYHTMEALCGGPAYTGTVGCRAATYPTSSGTKSGPSSEKQLVKTRVSTNVLNKFNPTHGGSYKPVMLMIYVTRNRLMFICKLIYSCRGLFSKRFSQTNFITKVTKLF